MSIGDEVVKYIKILERGEENTSNLASDQLRKIGKDTVPSVIELLKTCNDWNVRHFAIGILEDIHFDNNISDNKSVQSALINALKDHDSLVRCHAARVLGNFGRSAYGAVVALHQVLQDDKDLKVVLWAHYALAKITGEEEHENAVNYIASITKEIKDVQLDAAYATYLLYYAPNNVKQDGPAKVENKAEEPKRKK